MNLSSQGNLKGENKMIKVKSLNTVIATFADMKNLVENFEPFYADRLQNYTYIDTDKNEYIPWQVIRKAMWEK